MTTPCAVEVLQRGDHPFSQSWEAAENGRCRLRPGMRPDVRLSIWLDENEPPAGTYRLAADGLPSAEAVYPGASAHAGGRYAA